MNRKLRMLLEEMPVSVAQLRSSITGMRSKKEHAAALQLLDYLKKEEKHYILHLFTRPGLTERNVVPKELHGAIDTVDRAAKEWILTSVYTDPAFATIRQYAEKLGYKNAQALIAAYTEVRGEKK